MVLRKLFKNHEEDFENIITLGNYDSFFLAWWIPGFNGRLHFVYRVPFMSLSGAKSFERFWNCEHCCGHIVIMDRISFCTQETSESWTYVGYVGYVRVLMGMKSNFLSVIHFSLWNFISPLENKSDAIEVSPPYQNLDSQLLTQMFLVAIIVISLN